jgi:hypothetical protein
MTTKKSKKQVAVKKPRARTKVVQGKKSTPQSPAKSPLTIPSSTPTKIVSSPVLDQLATTYAYVIDLKGKKEPKQELDRMGRPTVMTQVTVQKLEHAFAYDSTVEEACIYAGIARQTYYNFIQEHPDFLDRVAELREGSIVYLRHRVLVDALDDGDKAMKYLERKRKQEFSLRTEVAHSGEVINRHAISPEAERLIQTAMGNFARKLDPWQLKNQK